MFSAAINWLLSIFSYLDYGSIVILMAIESSFFPLPSEVVMPPAGYLASLGRLSLLGVIVAGTVGSCLGALFNYWLSMTLGRTVLYSLADSRLGKMLLLSSKKLDKSEAYFNRYGRISTFIGRLLPVVRHLISIPAGLSKMPLLDFIAFTALGSFIWVTILAVLGYILGANWKIIVEYYIYYKDLTWLVLAGGGIFLIIYFVYKKQRRQKL